LDRREQADLETEALDRGPGRTQEDRLTRFGSAEEKSGTILSAIEAQKEDEVHQ
jgi:hypothetical protein